MSGRDRAYGFAKLSTGRVRKERFAVSKEVDQERGTSKRLAVTW